MKTNKLILLAAVATAAFTLKTPARAQFKPETNDGIAASPKVRQNLDERNAHQTAASHLVVATRPAGAESAVAASPKVAQMLAEHKVVPGSTTIEDSVSMTARSGDGITASPKVRQQLDERGAQIQIAPVK